MSKEPKRLCPKIQKSQDVCPLGAKATKAASTLFILLAQASLVRKLDRIALDFVDLDHFCRLLFLHQLQTDNLLSLADTQRTIVSEVVGTAAKQITTGASDCLVLELFWVQELRVAAFQGSCWFGVSNAGLGIIASEGRDYNLVCFVAVLLWVEGVEVMDTGAAREVCLGWAADFDVQGSGRVGGIASCGL